VTTRASRTDVTDIILQVAEGELVGSKNDIGDAVDANDLPFEKAFPYVAQPRSGTDARGGTPAKAGAKPASQRKGPDGKPMSFLNAGASERTTDAAGGAGLIGVLPIAALSGGAAFVLTGGLLWWRRKSPALGRHES
jgi:hypothetical protein